MAQIVEQIIRMGAVFLIADILKSSGQELTVELAVTGHLIGELASCFYTIFCFCIFPPKSLAPVSAMVYSASRFKLTGRLGAVAADFWETAPSLMTLALPLMGNRLILNVLASAEAIWIPNRLTMFGLNSSEAFGIYGVLTGMAMPAGVK